MTFQTLTDWIKILNKKFFFFVFIFFFFFFYNDAADTKLDREYKNMTMKTAEIFRDALQAVKIMHDENWLHRDLKPGNIDIVDTSARSVFLDLDTAIYIQAGAALQPEPGLLGTVGGGMLFPNQSYSWSTRSWTQRS